MAEASSPAPLPFVRFNFDAAEDAVEQLELTAQSLFELLAVLDLDLPVVRENWSGHFHDTFEVRISQAQIGAGFLATTLHEAAVLIRARAIQADAENQLRAQGRTSLPVVTGGGGRMQRV